MRSLAYIVISDDGVLAALVALAFLGWILGRYFR
jgi:hypothetical protein